MTKCIVFAMTKGGEVVDYRAVVATDGILNYLDDFSCRRANTLMIEEIREFCPRKETVEETLYHLDVSDVETEDEDRISMMKAHRLYPYSRSISVTDGEDVIDVLNGKTYKIDGYFGEVELEEMQRILFRFEPLNEVV